MGYFLLRRDGDAVTLIAPTVFDSRQEALAEVSRASAQGALDADEVFVIDLDAATPVLIVAPPTPAVELEAPETPEPVVEEEVPTGDAPTDDADAMVTATPVELVEAPIAAAVLADAEAASPSEPRDEVPESAELPEPESAVPEPDAPGEPEETDEPEEPEEVEEAADSGESVESPGEQPESSESPEPEPTPETVARTWPWEPVPAPMDVAEGVVEPPGETDDATDDAGASEEEADVSDDEADATPHDETEAEELEDKVAREEEADELPAEVSGLLADLEELAPTPPGEVGGETEPESEAPPASDDSDDEPIAEPTVSKAYEAGASDITMLTCDDCIYLNTCPKKGESDPTSCGSFQWKSV